MSSHITKEIEVNHFFFQKLDNKAKLISTKTSKIGSFFKLNSLTTCCTNVLYQMSLS